MKQESETSGVEIRDLSASDEYNACALLQEATWGANFPEFATTGILKITQKIGGIVAGAFDESGDLLGFVFGISGVRNGSQGHWSHMLAVVPERRDTGLGRALKKYQRKRLLELGIPMMYWTFDPLVARNAHFNINNLGVSIDQYVKSMYGDGYRGKLDSGIGTDRFIARWDLENARSQARLKINGDVKTVNSTFAEGIPLPGDIENSAEGDVIIEIPEDILIVKHQSAMRAKEWRVNTREAFEIYLGRGYDVVEFGRDAGSGRCFYRLELGSDS